MTARVLFYVQHLLGIGHLKRAEILAEAMAASGLDVTVAYGGIPIPEVPFSAVRLARLPAATIANEDFSKLLGEAGQPVDDAWKSARARALLDLWRQHNPDVVLLELFPFGRRQFAFELIPLLEAIRVGSNRARVASSVRDVLVASRKPGRDAQVVETVRRFFDAVLVHGDPTLVPFDATFKAAGEIADLIRHTGYVTAASEGAAPAGNGGDEVLVSAGGGAVGAPLLFAAMEARPLTALAGKRWRFLTGPNLPGADYAKLQAMTGEGAVVERFRTDFPALLKASALSISQAGYNTTMDILTSGARSIVIPYETKGETEQRLRAEILASKGLLTVVPAAELSPARLAMAIGEATAKPAVPLTVDISGATTTARLVRDLAVGRIAQGK
jgi:predicted glycosyltransferase